LILSSAATLLLLPLLAGPPITREGAQVDCPGGLAGLLALRARLISSREITKALTWVRGGEFLVGRTFSHRGEVLDSERRPTGEQRWAVELQVKYLGLQPWKAVEAELVDSKGRVLKVLAVRQERPLGQGKRSPLVVEVECPKGAPPGPYALTVWGEGRQQSVTVAGVRFP
jgi:uncharacterized protein (TIGR02268 family)